MHWSADTPYDKGYYHQYFPSSAKIQEAINLRRRDYLRKEKQKGQIQSDCYENVNIWQDIALLNEEQKQAEYWNPSNWMN